MKVSTSAVSSLLSFSSLFLGRLAHAESVCVPDPLDYHETIAMKVEKVGQVPTNATNPWSYNMMVMDNLDGDVIYFLDQQFGKVFAHDHSKPEEEVKCVFDINTSNIPPGLTLSWFYGGAAQTNKVKSITQGSSSDEIVVVFTSSTLPTGWTEADAKLPPEGAYSQWICGGKPDKNITYLRDIYRPGTLPECSDSGPGLTTFTGYDAFYTYTVVNGELTNPVPFFVSESFVGPGHLGGGIATVDDGRLLWSTGDCALFGIEGSYPPQLDNEACGKILLIDPASKGSFEIVAKGVRNSQQMRIFRKSDRQGGNVMPSRQFLGFMDIGGVTAEEVNAIPLSRIVDNKNAKGIANFGWGRSLVDGKAREGTFYVAPGNMAILGTEPPCEANAPINEPGFRQPWIQFGRTATDYYYAISSFAVPHKKVDRLKLIWTEFNTGALLGTDKRFKLAKQGYDGPVKGYKIKLYDAEGNYLENAFNDLVKAELGEVGYYRGDPRIFHFPDGQAGVFIERTGAFYKLEETAVAP